MKEVCVYVTLSLGDTVWVPPGHYSAVVNSGTGVSSLCVQHWFDTRMILSLPTAVATEVIDWNVSLMRDDAAGEPSSAVLQAQCWFAEAKAKLPADKAAGST